MDDWEDEPVNAARPPRPHHKLTDDGRRVREVLTYTRRGNRFTPNQAEGWAAHQADWVIPDEAVDRPDFDLAGWFGREAPMIVEIGSGIGEATAALAATRPERQHPCLRGLAAGDRRRPIKVAAAGADNVRFCGVDAVWSLEHLIAPDSLAELWTFFPDPWHKTKHHKRRLVTPANAAIAASRLQVGATWRLATDWAGVRRADDRGARRRAAARGRTRRALGRATHHPLRAQGPREGPRHHRPGLHPTVTATEQAHDGRGGSTPPGGSPRSPWPR